MANPILSNAKLWRIKHTDRKVVIPFKTAGTPKINAKPFFFIVTVTQVKVKSSIINIAIKIKFDKKFFKLRLALQNLIFCNGINNEFSSVWLAAVVK